MKNFYHLVAILVLLALVAIPLTGCVKVVYSTASLSEATMTTGVDKNFRPLDITSVFTSDLPEIFCSVKLSNAPPDTKIKAEWVYIRGEAESLKDYSIDSWSGETEGTHYIYASLTRPDKGWPNGDYKVVWYIDGTEKLTVPFKIQAGTAPTVQPAGVSLPNIFQEPKFVYTIRYPADWTYEIPGAGTLHLMSQKGVGVSGIVSIQTAASTEIGGAYENVDELINEAINPIKAADANAKIYNVGTASYTAEDGQQLIGKTCTIEYTYQGLKAKRLMVVLPHGELFHLWYYEAEQDVYDAYSPTVEAMLKSWTLKKIQ